MQHVQLIRLHCLSRHMVADIQAMVAVTDLAMLVVLVILVVSQETILEVATVPATVDTMFKLCVPHFNCELLKYYVNVRVIAVGIVDQ